MKTDFVMDDLQTASFFALGVASAGGYAGLNSVLDRWNRGCIELFDSLNVRIKNLNNVVYATRTAMDMTFGDAWGDHGVFEYEVSEPFGLWFGNEILKDANEPTQGACIEWLAEAVAEFYVDGVHGITDRDVVKEEIVMMAAVFAVDQRLLNMALLTAEEAAAAAPRFPFPKAEA